MKNMGRKSVKGATSAPMLAKASNNKMGAAAPKQPPTHEEIARRSYEIYLASGAQDGHDVEHWIQAEHDLAT